MSEPTIHASLAAVMGAVDHVAKRDRNTAQNFLFRGIDAVVNAVGPALRTHKVVVVPEVESVDYATVQTTTGKPATACRVVVRYTFHGPAGDSLSCLVAGEAWDAGDKATPKAMSVAFRTALLQSLSLPTDEPDPDSQTFERAPQVSVRQLQMQVWARSKEIAPNMTDDERKQLIADELRDLGGDRDNPDTLTRLLKEWEK